MAKAETVIPTRNILALATRVFKQDGNQIFSESPEREASKFKLSKLLKAEELPTEAELVEADSIIDQVGQRIALNALKGTKIKSEFINRVFTYVSKPASPAWAGAFLIWAPKVLNDLAQRDEQNLEMQANAITSTWFGTAGDKIELEVKVQECRFVTHIGKFSVVAKTAEDNFVTFWFGKNIENTVKIKGRIKGHRVNQFIGNAKTTLLNFVKVVD